MARKQAGTARPRLGASRLAAQIRELAETLSSAVDDLDDLSAHYAIIGGIAVGIRALPRTTTDIDFAVSVEADAEADALIFALHQRGYRVGDVFQRRDGRVATVRTTHRDHPHVFVDLLFGSSRIEPEVVREATRVEVYGRIKAPVAQLWHLLAMKVKANRTKDGPDLQHLIERATVSDLAKTEAALRLMQARGAGPGRDLVAELRHTIERVNASNEELVPVSRARRARLLRGNSKRRGR